MTSLLLYSKLFKIDVNSSINSVQLSTNSLGGLYISYHKDSSQAISFIYWYDSPFPSLIVI